MVILSKTFGLDRELNPGPLAPEARIIPLDHQATLVEGGRQINVHPFNTNLTETAKESAILNLSQSLRSVYTSPGLSEQSWPSG